MITAVIRASVAHRGLVLLVSALLMLVGVYALKTIPVDAIPDLSPVQVIVKTRYPGQSPQTVQDQVTYPLTTAMLSVPRARTVRGFSFLGDSYVYVIFDEGTDLYWARSRVLEYLNQVSGDLPAGAKAELGPDATGVGWIFNYALVDRTGKHSLAELRSLQDWFLKFELQSVPGVAEVASVGGMVKQYQVVVDPEQLRAQGIPLTHVREAISRANGETSAGVVELAEAEYMVRVTGYLQSVADLAAVPLGVNAAGTPLLLGDIARIEVGPERRRGIVELNGEGEVTGGIVVMRSGENAAAVIAAVKDKIALLQPGLPAGVELLVTYDRSTLIEGAVANLYQKLIEEFLVVALVCALFLFHLRSALVVLLSLPLGIFLAFMVMHWQGINANIMSLGGVAIAIGAMVDGAVVMIENLHKHLERAKHDYPDGLPPEVRWKKVTEAASEVGPALFFSLLIITLSFLPVFALEAEEGKLFAPLAFTKTYAMAAAAILAVTLVPVLLGYLVRGNIVSEAKNPLNRLVVALYRPLLVGVLRYPKALVLTLVCVTVAALWPVQYLGREFMPPLDEGDLMYMPTTHPGVSIAEARQILQQTDRLIKTLPEVKTVFGKIGRADTATDPAPLTMIETVIQFYPKDQWREGVTPASLRAELNQLIQFPGLTNAFVMPVKTRIDMLSTGVKTPVGIKISGPDLAQIQALGKKLEPLLKQVPGTASVYAEEPASGRYIEVAIDRLAAARFGLNVRDLQALVATAVGGERVTETVEGLERYSVNLRYPAWYRDSLDSLQRLPILTQAGTSVQLQDVAKVIITDGPAVIKSENARTAGWVLVDITGRDLGGYVNEAQALVARELRLPTGYSLGWTGQYESLTRARDRLAWVVPVTLMIIVLLLYINFRRISEVLMILLTLPFALAGGVLLLWWLNFSLSVAVIMGFIATAGVAIEIGVLMLVYLNLAYAERRANCAENNRAMTRQDLREAVMSGAGLRLRPIVMTAATLFVGLLPVLLADGIGSEVMQRIAAPMVGGIISTLILSLLVLPALYYVWHDRQLRKSSKTP